MARQSPPDDQLLASWPCKACGEDVPATGWYWDVRGKRKGGRCARCASDAERIRQQEVRTRRKAERADEGASPAPRRRRRAKAKRTQRLPGGTPYRPDPEGWAVGVTVPERLAMRELLRRYPAEYEGLLIRCRELMRQAEQP